MVNQGDRMIVAALGSTAMAGLYALCVNIANKSVAAVVAVNSFVLPHAAGLQAAGRDDMRPGLVHALERSVAVLLLPVLVPALLLADTFFRLWLGGFATPELTIGLPHPAHRVRRPGACRPDQQRPGGERRVEPRRPLLVDDGRYRVRRNAVCGTALRPDRRRHRGPGRAVDVAAVRREGAPDAAHTSRTDTLGGFAMGSRSAAPRRRHCSSCSARR